MNAEEKIFNGKIFNADDKYLKIIRHRAHQICQKYNSIDENSSRRPKLIRKLFGSIGSKFLLQGPIEIDYGTHTCIGDNFYANFNLTILDTAKVFIGDNVMFGPNVTIIATTHPLIASERFAFKFTDGEIGVSEYAREVHIGNNVWLGGNVVVLGGVTIGDGAVIGAGSVVTRDIPDGYVAYGNPCRPQRPISESDSKMDLL